jgi:hypothetical protein
MKGTGETAAYEMGRPLQALQGHPRQRQQRSHWEQRTNQYDRQYTQRE